MTLCITDCNVLTCKGAIHLWCPHRWGGGQA